MQIFIDESGDCGMKGRRSAQHFAVAAAMLPSSDSVARCETAIQAVRETLGVPEDYEFHFARISNAHRREFLRQMSHHEFSFVAWVLDKRKVHGDYWQEKRFFYEKVIGAVVGDVAAWFLRVQAPQGGHSAARVTFDDNDDPVYLKVLREQFRRVRSAAGRPVVKKVRPGRSRSSALLQLADMVCGAVVRWHEGDDTYLRLIRKRGEAKRLLEKN